MTTTSRRRERCAIYTRQSVARRGGDPTMTSCIVQYNRCLELVMSRGWEPIPELFDDEGQSGENPDRPALMRLVQRIEDGAVDRVVVWRLDRLSRTMSDWVEFDAILRSRGIGFTVGDGTIDRTGSSLAAFQMNMLATFAQFEREMIADRIRDGRAARSARGERTAGTVPIGYTTDRRTKQLVVDRATAPLVRWMFERADVGVLPAQIAREASERQADGRAWSARTVLRVLQNQAHVGRLRDGRHAVHAALVEPALFDRVVAAIAARARARHRHARSTSGRTRSSCVACSRARSAGRR